MKTPHPTITMPKSLATRPPLSEEDWNFTTEQQVPDKELVPCLLWEYLRESQTARQLMRDWTELFTASDAANRDQKTLATKTQALPVKINHELRIPEFMYYAVALVSGLKKLANVPWQKLHPKTKQFLVEPCHRVNKPVFIGLEMHAGELAADARKRFDEEIAKTPGVTAPAAFEELKAQPGLKIPVARGPLRIFKFDTYWEALCVVVDWGRYDDSAIRAGFAELAEEIINSRPAGIEPQTLKGWGLRRDAGDNSEWRGKLRDLGRTRLHCHYEGMAHFKTAFPAAHAWLASNLGEDKGTRAITKSLSDGASRFKKAFLQILPFERGNLPLCLAAVGDHRRISK